MREYPTVQEALEAARELAPVLRGQVPDTKLGVKAGWIVAGYAASLTVGEPGEVGPQVGYSTVPAASTVEFGPEALADWLDTFQAGHQTGAAHSTMATVIPWADVLTTLLALILKWKAQGA